MDNIKQRTVVAEDLSRCKEIVSKVMANDQIKSNLFIHHIICQIDSGVFTIKTTNYVKIKLRNNYNHDS